MLGRKNFKHGKGLSAQQTLEKKVYLLLENIIIFFLINKDKFYYIGIAEYTRAYTKKTPN